VRCSSRKWKCLDFLEQPTDFVQISFRACFWYAGDKAAKCLLLLLWSLVVQVNQIGSVTESIEAVIMAKKAGWGVMTSHRRLAAYHLLKFMYLIKRYGVCLFLLFLF
jgi:hypothetical protein